MTRREIRSPHRWTKAQVSIVGTTQFHLRNPYVIAWWSAAFPGFGHLLLNKYLRGLGLFVWEVIINYKSEVNLAMVHSFCGDIAQAKADLDTRWVLMYIPVYIFAIWDSYRTTVDMNKVYLLSNREDAPIKSFSLGALEVNYLDKRYPLMSVFWSTFMPGLGQLYIHRIITALFSLTWTVVFLYYSHTLEGVLYLFWGNIKESARVLDPQWLLYMPSMWGFAVYDSYINTVENNKLFENEQRKYLESHYQNPHFRILKKAVDRP